jgi:hypothetical protein
MPGPNPDKEPWATVHHGPPSWARVVPGFTQVEGDQVPLLPSTSLLRTERLGVISSMSHSHVCPNTQKPGVLPYGPPLCQLLWDLWLPAAIMGFRGHSRL